MANTREKYAVDIDESVDKSASDKGHVKCPDCGSELLTEVNVPKCPKCGTKPFEQR